MCVQGSILHPTLVRLSHKSTVTEVPPAFRIQTLRKMLLSGSAAGSVTLNPKSSRNQAHIRHMIHTIVHDWGFKYLKRFVWSWIILLMGFRVQGIGLSDMQLLVFELSCVSVSIAA